MNVDKAKMEERSERQNQSRDGIISLIVPTRGRPANIQRFLRSLRATTAHLNRVELVLVIDDDDRSYDGMSFEGFWITTVVTPSGSTMGDLNRAGYYACSGDYIMLLNDDVLIETSGWDQTISDIFRAHPDNIVLIHVNDTIFQDKLCTFPFLTRQFCELAGGICPAGYRRYRIDDHIYNVFNLLSVLGKDRIVYLPDVVFRHLNFVTDEIGKIEYQPDPKIHEADTEIFNTAFRERKALALRSADVIDEYRRRQILQVRNLLLEPISDSIALRRPEFVRTLSSSSQLNSQQVRVTIGVVSADIHSEHARACLSAIKAYTNNFDLVVLDNNRGPNFNHPREMNSLLSVCRNNYLVLMDDDVIVEPGWLNGLLSGMGPHVGVVTPLHKSVDGRLSYAGVAMRPDHSGHHTHAFALYPHAFPIQTLCSAIILIDMNKCGQIRFDESYSKYFLDLDYGLRIWEQGFQVVCSPNVIVTHIGGATLDWASAKSSKLFEEQRQHFVRCWINTGRYQAIESSPSWRALPEINVILGIPERFSELLRGGVEADSDRALSEAHDFFDELDLFPTVKHWVSEKIWAELRDRTPDFTAPEGRRYAALAGQLEFPIALGQVEGFAIVLWSRRYYAVPMNTGAFDGAKAANGVYRSASRRNLLISSIHTNFESVPIKSDEMQPVLVVENYRGFNLVRFDRVYGLAQREGAFDVMRASSGGYPLNGETIECVKAQIDALEPVLVEENYKGFNLVQLDQIYALAQSKGAFDPASAARGGYPLHGPTVEAVRKQIDKVPPAVIYLRRVSSRVRSVLARQRPSPIRTKPSDKRQRPEDGQADSSRWVALDPARPIVDDYNGFTISRFEYKFFATPRSKGPFSYEAYRRNEYGVCPIGHSVEEVKKIIDRQSGLEAVGSTRLVFASLADEKMRRALSATDRTVDWLMTGQDQNADLGSQNRIVVDSPSVIDWATDVVAGKAEVDAIVKQQRFETVTIPWAYPETWKNNFLEVSASRIANHIEVVTEAGANRSYHGETVHRLLYNKAYLASMLEVVPFRESMNVLEVGCSDGLVCDIVSLLGAHKVTGVDVMTTVGCSFQGANGEFFTMDATDLRFDDGSFDLIYSIATLEHVANPYRAIEEMIRTLRVGGYCYVQAAPLYYSPFGHHMFAYFADYPWAHLRLTKEEIVGHLKQQGKDDDLLRNFGVSPETYIEEMLNPDHLNGLTLDEYRLDDLRQRTDIQILKLNPSYEGEDLLTPSILDQIKEHMPGLGQRNLIEHGFELAFRRLS